MAPFLSCYSNTTKYQIYNNVKKQGEHRRRKWPLS